MRTALKSQLDKLGFSLLPGRDPLQVSEKGCYMMNSVSGCDGFGEGDP